MNNTSPDFSAPGTPDLAGSDALWRAYGYPVPKAHSDRSRPAYPRGLHSKESRGSREGDRPRSALSGSKMSPETESDPKLSLSPSDLDFLLPHGMGFQKYTDFEFDLHSASSRDAPTRRSSSVGGVPVPEPANIGMLASPARDIFYLSLSHSRPCDVPFYRPVGPVEGRDSASSPVAELDRIGGRSGLAPSYLDACNTHAGHLRDLECRLNAPRPEGETDSNEDEPSYLQSPVSINQYPAVEKYQHLQHLDPCDMGFDRAQSSV